MKTELVGQISAYLEGRVGLKELVYWAEGLVMDGFEADPIESEIVHRLGVADAENFELTWEELAHMLHRLGYAVRLELQPA
ncbi:MAG: hypothetical protein IAE79_17825 [Anaerolinea sp.]|nr:hypothetical protein [Anaerolinea sp.]